jgi:hypothetical protein
VPMPGTGTSDSGNPDAVLARGPVSLDLSMVPFPYALCAVESTDPEIWNSAENFT